MMGRSMEMIKQTVTAKVKVALKNLKIVVVSKQM